VGQSPDAKPKVSTSRPSWVSAPLAPAITALALLAAVAGWFVSGSRLMKPAQAGHLSIVVLPFANLSGDPSQDYFADAISDNLTTEISRLAATEAPLSRVIARNTAFTYKGKNVDATEIGKELDVRCILEGSGRLTTLFFVPLTRNRKDGPKRRPLACAVDVALGAARILAPRSVLRPGRLK
jgi:hypothetical protein